MPTALALVPIALANFLTISAMGLTILLYILLPSSLAALAIFFIPSLALFLPATASVLPAIVSIPSARLSAAVATLLASESAASAVFFKPINSPFFFFTILTATPVAAPAPIVIPPIIPAIFAIEFAFAIGSGLLLFTAVLASFRLVNAPAIALLSVIASSSISTSVFSSPASTFMLASFSPIVFISFLIAFHIVPRMLCFFCAASASASSI